MKNSIKKFEQLPEELKKKQAENEVSFSVGDMFFYDREGEIIKIREINKDAGEWDSEKGKTIKVWQVLYDSADNWEATKWSSYGSDKYDSFIKKVASGQYVKIDRPLKEIVDEANKVISGEISIDVYSRNEFEESVNEETALIGRNSKQSLITIQNSLQQKKRTADLIHKAVAYEMEKRKQELDKIKDQLYEVVAKFEKQIKKIKRVITTIELYLGIDEEIHQIQEGEKAPADTPISFRQLVLFIDEEVGVHEDGGLDWQDIKRFDEWLLKGNNLDIVLPEKKGMVVLRPRRYDKDYTNDAWLNMMMNIPNHRNTYILIRNGDNVHRIFTEKLVISDRLFPRRKELHELYEKMQEESWDRKKEEIEDEMYQYKKRAVLMQGLIDRTEIFHPLPVEKLNIFKLHDAQEYVNFIYDDEMQIGDGRLSFWKWKAKINSKITVGSRVLITGEYERQYRSDFSGRWYKTTRSGDHVTYDLPKAGVYEVYKIMVERWGDFPHYYIEELEEKGLLISKGKQTYRFCPGYEKHEGHEKPRPGVQVRIVTKQDGKRKSEYIESYDCKYLDEHLIIKYNPGGTVYEWGSWDSHERKNRVSFRIYTDDDFVINYDQIDSNDIDYYLKSRVDRKKYLHMMPVLKTTKQHLIEEEKNEQHFIKFVAGRNNVPEERAKEAVRWWKYKNKWKRPITKDDTLALRMIEKRILSKNYKSFTKY